MFDLRARLAPLLALTLLAACAANSPGAGGKMCTQIGCINGLRLILAKVTPWTAGNYRFAFELDGAAVNCSGALPLPACDQGAALRCDVADRVMIGESGCALPPEQHGFSDIQVMGAPTKVKLEIKREDESLYSGELSPTYVTSRPNGPDCEPECRGATAEVALP